MKLRIATRTLFAFALATSSFGQAAKEPEAFRKWTQKATGRVITGKIEGKRNEGKEIRILLENHNSVWIEVKSLSDEDQAFAAKWEEQNLKLTAQTVATSTKRGDWAETWTAEAGDKAAFLTAAGKDKWNDRTLGITLDNRGTELPVVVDVFWFGFPLSDKNQRFVNARATKIFTLEPEKQTVIPCEGGCRYKERSLAYMEADFQKLEIQGLFLKSWSGYTYAGWAVRVSTLDGELLAQQGAQPAFLNRIANVPVPVLAEKKKP